MHVKAKPLVRAICLSIALMGATAITTTLLVPDAAYAKNEKAKGKSDKAKGKSAEAKSKKPKAKPEKAKGAKPQKAKRSARSESTESEEEEAAEKSGKKPYRGGNKIAVTLGVHPSELGNLNSWNSDDAADESEGMPGRLADYEEFVVWSNSMGMAQEDIDAAAELFGAPTCEETEEGSDCYYDPAIVFEAGIPVEGEEGYEDYLILVAANDAFELVEAEGDEYEEFGEDAEIAALRDIANKEVDEDLFTKIRDWILANSDTDS